jgi:hypothetical protein
MKIRLRPDDPGMLKEPDWRQMNDWLAELRDDGPAEPIGAGDAESAAAGRAEPDAAGLAEPITADPAEQHAVSPAEQYGASRAERYTASRSGPYRPVTSTERRARHEDSDNVEITVGSIIGDQLRMPIMWCEMGSCISWHADRAALGEADTRARAIDAGWRVDALGRLACPRCQQTDPGFRASYPVTPWNRQEAITTAARMGIARGDRTASAYVLPVSPRD